VGRASFSARLCATVAAALACLFVSAAAAADGYRYKNVAADRAAASRIVLRLADIGSPTEWSAAGSPVPRGESSCPGPAPKLSDLVVTGDALSQFQSVGGLLYVSSIAQVFETSKMLEASWRREIASSRAFTCVRASLENEVGSLGRISSFKQLAFPRMGSHTRAFRAFVRSERISLVVDTIVFSRGRTLSALTMGGVIDSPQLPSVLLKAEQRLVSVMLSRVAVLEA
jgi:hypothetical protein